MNELYDQIGNGYAAQRKPDLKISAFIQDQLQGAASVLNVGAGFGSYEPDHLPVVAVEPSSKMISQRQNSLNVIRARAEALPFKNRSFDAVMMVLTVHHWQDQQKGLWECARVARKRLVIMTWDPASDGFWLVQDYFPDLLAHDLSSFPGIDELGNAAGKVSIIALPIPAECTDGFLGAYWRRPEAYLDAGVRMSISSFSRIAGLDVGLEKLRRDLESGDWKRRYRHLLTVNSLDIGYRLVIVELD